MRIFKSLLYYVSILLPLVCIAGLVIDQVNAKIGVIMLFVYVFVYRPFTDAWRLWDRKILARKNLLQHYPFWRLKWLRDLYRL